MKLVRKAIIAAAGLGTRFLPQAKAMPKEMMPLLDKPIIQHIAEELVQVGVTDIIIVTGPQKRAIEDHFDRAMELEEALRKKGKAEAAEEIKRIGEMANFIYIRQKGYPVGTARPVINASHLINDEPFFFFTGDDIFLAKTSRAKQLLDAYNQTGKTIISLVEISPEDSDKYGMAKIKAKKNDQLSQIEAIVEKPGKAKTPSNYAVIMSYLFTPEVLPFFRHLEPGIGGEIHAVDAVTALAQEDEVYGRLIEGTYYDCGNKLSYLKAVIDFGLADPKIKIPLDRFLRSRLSG